MYPSMNIQYVPKASIIKLSIVPYNSTFVKQSYLDNTTNIMFAKIICKLDKQDKNIKALFE